MKFTIKPKPKIKLGKLLKDKELEIKELPTEIKYIDEISEKDNVIIEVKTTVDLNWQKSMTPKERLQSFMVKVTKKF